MLSLKTLIIWLFSPPRSRFGVFLPIWSMFIFKNQSYLKFGTMMLHNNFEGNLTDTDLRYEVNFPIINKTLKLETEKRAYILLGIIILIMLISLYCAKKLIVKTFSKLRNARSNRKGNTQHIRLEPMRLSRPYRNSRLNKNMKSHFKLH